jgi:hypothetical protein
MADKTRTDLTPQEQTRLSEQTAPNRSPVEHDGDRNADQRNRRHDHHAPARSGFGNDDAAPPAVTGDSPAAPGPPSGASNG